MDTYMCRFANADDMLAYMVALPYNQSQVPVVVSDVSFDAELSRGPLYIISNNAIT